MCLWSEFHNRLANPVSLLLRFKKDSAIYDFIWVYVIFRCCPSGCWFWHFRLQREYCSTITIIDSISMRLKLNRTIETLKVATESFYPMWVTWNAVCDIENQLNRLYFFCTKTFANSHIAINATYCFSATMSGVCCLW